MVVMYFVQLSLFITLISYKFDTIISLQSKHRMHLNILIAYLDNDYNLRIYKSEFWTINNKYFLWYDNWLKGHSHCILQINHFIEAFMIHSFAETIFI